MAIERQQALTHVGKAGACPLIAAEANAVVDDVDVDVVPDRAGTDRERDGPRLRLQAVADRVFHQRLQQHGG